MEFFGDGVSPPQFSQDGSATLTQIFCLPNRYQTTVIHPVPNQIVREARVPTARG
jgi:hypothetical protein